MKLPNFLKKIIKKSPIWFFYKKLFLEHNKKYGNPKNKEQRANLISISRFSRRHGVDFSYVLQPEEIGFSRNQGYAYEPSYDLADVLSWLNVGEKDAIVDFGCGKGWALYQLAKLPFGRVDGLELSSQLIEIAQKNISKLYKNDDRFHFYCTDVLEFKNLDDYNYIYMFNPFPAFIFNKMLDTVLYDSLKRKPRKITIIYQNPQFARFLEEKGIFKCVYSNNKTSIFANDIQNYESENRL